MKNEKKLTKEEKQKLKAKYKKTEEGKIVSRKLNQAFILMGLSIIFSIYLIVDTYLNKSNPFYYIYAGALIVVAISFVFMYFHTWKKILNNLKINEQKKK